MYKKSILRRFVSLSLTATFLVIGNQISQASLGGIEDYNNPRIVPMYNDAKSGEINYSAFLYSPRILFTVAHGEYYFDNNGNRIARSPQNTYAGLPNSKAEFGAPRVKVIKRIVSKTYRFDNATLGDFAVFVLEKDLANVSPVKLLTPAIEAELISNNSEIQLHGYGKYSDACTFGNKPPCSDISITTSNVPRMLNAKIYSLSQVENLVGYKRPQLKGSLTYFKGGKENLCPGDSGGSSTVKYMGQLLYLSVTGNVMNGYICGIDGDYDGVGGIIYTSPVYDHLDIIKEAEDFVAEQLKLEAAANPQPAATPTPALSSVASSSQAKKVVPKLVTIICVKGKTLKKVTALIPKCPAGYKKGK